MKTSTSRKSGSKSAKNSPRPAKRTNGKRTPNKDISKIFEEGTAIDKAFDEAVREAIPRA